MQGVLFRHFEKGVLVAFGVFALVVVKPIVARPAELAAQDDVRKLDAAVEMHLDLYSPELPPVPDRASELRASVAAPAPVEEFPHWLSHKRPNFIFTLPIIEPPPASTHLAPQLEVTATHGSVTIEWKPSKDPEECIVTRYVVQRTDEKGATIVLADTKDAGKLTDDKVEPRATYTYSVTEMADPAPSHAPLALADVALVASKTVALPREFIVVPDKEVTLGGVLNQPVAVKIVVWRWRDGKWLRKEFFAVKLGEKIGKKDAKQDFATGAELLEIAAEKGKSTIKIKWANGLVETVGSSDTYDELKKVLN